MPELPEVEVLARHLDPRLRGRTIREVEVRRARVIRPLTEAELRSALVGATFGPTTRRAKYLCFEMQPRCGAAFRLIGHLGMTGRMFLQPRSAPLPKHAAVVLDLGPEWFVFEDTRAFGRLNLDGSVLDGLGPEPLSEAWTAEALRAGLGRSSQAVKVKLLDQRLVAGVGNIYASEALFRAGISPRRPAEIVTKAETVRLHAAIRVVLSEAIAMGGTIPLSFAGGRDGLFYYGASSGDAGRYEQRFRVYDREGQACPKCGTVIRRIVQAQRSTFFCSKCQR